ncbi:MAG: 5'/3'-nucleotidase SurE, partial [Gemmatimonadetes bacterium]|nr:5'/3'-nucleotidase SurE [Gemmatimonadota bacterium]
RILRHIMALPTFPASTLLNVNIPPIAADAVKGVRLTRLGRRVYSESLTKMKDPWGRPIYWIGGGSVSWQGSTADSDFQAIADGYVSVTPLHLDLTNTDILNTAEQWWRPL